MVLTNILVKPLWILGVERWVQNNYQAQYADYFLVYSLVIMFNIILDFGLNAYVAVAYSGNVNRLKEDFFSLSTLKIALSFVYFCFTFLYFGFMQLPYDWLRLLVLLGFNQFIISIISYCRALLTAQQHYRLDAFVSVFDKLCMLLVVALLWVFDIFSWDNFIYSQVIALLFSLMITVALTFQKTIAVKVKLNTKIIVNAIPALVPFVIIVLSANFYLRNDTFYLKYFHPLQYNQLVNEYAAANRLFECASMFSVMFGTLLLPVFSYCIAIKQSVDDLISIAIRLLGTAFVLLFVWVFYQQKQIAIYLYPTFESKHSLSLVLLVASLLPQVLMHVFGSLLLAQKSAWLFVKISILALVFNIIINGIFTSNFTIIGTTSANFLTQFFVGVSLAWCSRKHYSGIALRPIYLRLLAYAILLLIIGFLLSNYNFSISTFTLLIAIATCILIFALKLINKQDLINLFEFKNK
jgi:O-antigen/teichoic acid export membrane protein